LGHYAQLLTLNHSRLLTRRKSPWVKKTYLSMRTGQLTKSSRPLVLQLNLASSSKSIHTMKYQWTFKETRIQSSNVISEEVQSNLKFHSTPSTSTKHPFTKQLKTYSCAWREPLTV
jgi:hypothetical protein